MNQSQTGGEGERRIKNFANMSKMDQGDMVEGWGSKWEKNEKFCEYAKYFQ